MSRNAFTISRPSEHPTNESPAVALRPAASHPRKEPGPVRGCESGGPGAIPAGSGPCSKPDRPSNCLPSMEHWSTCGPSVRTLETAKDNQAGEAASAT